MMGAFSTPFFSIIIPVYNVDSYLDDAIGSVLSQNHSHYEIVLVDDGSMDESGRICEEYGRLYPDRVVVLHQENRGLFEARKSGLRMATGEYILFLDGDDELREDALSRLSAIAQETEADVIAFRCCRNRDYEPDSFSAYHSLGVRDPVDYSIEEFRYQLLVSDRINGICLKAARRECYQDLIKQKKRIRLQLAEDKLVSAYVLDRARSVSLTSDVLYHYRLNLQSISQRSFSLADCGDLLFVYDHMREAMDRWGLGKCEDELDALLLSQIHDQIIRLYEARLKKEERIRAIDGMRGSIDAKVLGRPKVFHELKSHRRMLLKKFLNNRNSLGFYARAYMAGIAFMKKVRGR